ncbi:hypothetical protein PtA15_14A358 [Puccinia triticina]|uniref:Uncharacterized protein n=1 Tax=Puccinia triticina TaxID=208348 RepID=A0ABY7D1M3_9BASI|nr:uncharacterized protein PtA15_14A358 [Puccinia triticina]WAQ91474.1 hypothetical protein PtA15_14A358 [Puccinia triticina]
MAGSEGAVCGDAGKTDAKENLVGGLALEHTWILKPEPATCLQSETEASEAEQPGREERVNDRYPTRLARSNRVKLSINDPTIPSSIRAELVHMCDPFQKRVQTWALSDKIIKVSMARTCPHTSD